MQFYPSFNFNYPLNKRTPNWFPNQSKEIIKKANSILKKRNNEEIQYAFLIINHIRLVASSEITRNIDSLKNKKDQIFISDFGNYNRKNELSPSQHLNNEIEKTDIYIQMLLFTATNSEFFAVLALALISELFNEFNFSDSKTIKDKKHREIDNLKTAGSILIDAKEAICLSEQFRTKPPQREIILKEAEELIKIKNKESAIKGNRPKEIIGNIFLSYRHSKNFSTDIEAINKFMETLPDQQKNTLPKDYVRFFRKKIREHK